MKNVILIILFTSNLFALSLNEAIKELINNNHEIELANKDLEINNQRVSQKKYSNFGEFDFVSSYSKYNEKRTLAPITPPITGDITTSDEPINITMVTGELEQVIINIINNAKDAIKENNISKPWIKVDLKRSQGYIVLSIEDNGGGIPEDILPKIFEPYFTTKDQNQGTGLGLHMSKRIIDESMQGRLYAKNTQNGVAFIIELPLEEELLIKQINNKI